MHSYAPFNGDAAVLDDQLRVLPTPHTPSQPPPEVVVDRHAVLLLQLVRRALDHRILLEHVYHSLHPHARTVVQDAQRRRQLRVV